VSNTNSKSQNLANHGLTAYEQAAIVSAGVKTSKIKSKFNFAQCDLDDINQELLVKMLEQASHFDSARGAQSTFTRMLADNRGYELVNGLIKSRTHEYLANESESANSNYFDDVRSENPDFDSLWQQDEDLFSQSDALHDLEAAVKLLTKDQHQLFTLICESQSLTAAQKNSNLSSSTFYRHVDELKMHLRMFGLAIAA